MSGKIRRGDLRAVFSRSPRWALKSVLILVFVAGILPHAVIGAMIGAWACVMDFKDEFVEYWHGFNNISDD